MSETVLKLVKLDPDRLAGKESTAAFLKEALDFPESFSGNLDALSDLLSEVRTDTVFEVETGVLDRFEKDDRLKRVLRVFSDAARENPHLHLYLTDAAASDGLEI